MRAVAAGLGTLAAAALVLVLVAWLGQHRLVYLPHGRPDSPVAAGLGGARAVTIDTPDGLALDAWWLPPPDPPGPAALVLPGNAGSREHRVPLAAVLAQRGLGVLLLDYRGFGGNPGRPSQTGLLADARGAAAFLRGRDDVDPERILYWGESLGAAVAGGLAIDEPPAAMVLRSPFSTLAEVGALHYPFLPVRALLRDRYPLEEWIAGYRGPLLVVAGAQDSIVPPEQSRRVHAAAGGRSRLVLVPAADHNDRALLDGEHLIEAVERFLLDARLRHG